MKLSTLGVLQAILGLATSVPLDASIPVPPTQDSWYTAPPQFERAAPGTILRHRLAVGNLSTLYNSSAAYQLLFRTTDSHYKPSWAVTTLFLPKTSNGTRALLSYQIPYNSVDLDASPSYALYGPGYSTSGGPVAWDIQTGLRNGWAVNVPDFEGHLAAFTAGVMEGHATIDSIRSSLHFLKNMKQADEATRIAMWGYSGGSIASEWAAELQVQYAPELSIAGTALGGLVSNTSNALLNHVSGTRFAGLLPEWLLGLGREYPEAREYLLSQLKTSGPYNRTGFLAAEKMDTTTAFTVYNGTDIWNFFIRGKDSIQDSALLRKIMDRDGVMGYHGVPQMPLFVYKAVQDEITPIEDTDVLVDRYCGIGANIFYQRNTVGGHLAEMTNGDSYALAFLDSVLNDRYGHTGCTIRNVAWNTVTSPI